MDLNNTKTAFRHLSDRDLRRNRFVFGLIKRPALSRVLTFLASSVIKYNLPFKFIIRDTVFNVFCAGENSEEVLGTMNKLKTFHVNTVLDYVAEGENSEAIFIQNQKKILRNIDLCSESGPKQFIGVKPSSLTNCECLFDFAKNNLSYADVSERPEIKSLHTRMEEICEYAKGKNVYVYFDAEEYLSQGYFDGIVEDLMKKFNKDQVIVFNTVQLYLTDRITYLNRVISEFREEGVKLGLKLVRGAYLEQERELAKSQNRRSPVFSSKEETDASYNEAVRLCLQNHSFVYTCLATHNQESIELGVKLIDELNIADHYNRVFFSQLFGMSDNLTYNLALSKYNSSKYVPYGELKKAVPYLIRRAEENSSMGGQTLREYEILDREWKRRYK